MKKLLCICLGLLYIATMMLIFEYCYSPEKRRAEIRNYWCRQYDVDFILIEAIVNHETGHGKWIARNDWKVLHKQAWAWKLVKKYNLDFNDWKTWASLGDMQILYLTALELGYRGDPETLMNNFSTNYKYGVRYFSDLRNSYDSTSHAVASYNAGRPRFDSKGRYLNYSYVSNIKYELTNLEVAHGLKTRNNIYIYFYCLYDYLCNMLYGDGGDKMIRYGTYKYCNKCRKHVLECKHKKVK